MLSTLIVLALFKEKSTGGLLKNFERPLKKASTFFNTSASHIPTDEAYFAIQFLGRSELVRLSL
jgi:hypothetical protein